MTGSLEAHGNGFRYTSVRGDKVRVIKYMFVKYTQLIFWLLFNLHSALLPSCLYFRIHSERVLFGLKNQIKTPLG